MVVGGSFPNGYSYVPGYANGTFVQGNLICTSDSNCFLTSNRHFDVSEVGIIQVAASLTYSSRILSSIGLPDIGEDPYFGYGSFGFWDELEGWDFEFRYTPDRVFATFGRLSGKPSDFLYMVPVANNTGAACLDQAIVLEKCKKSASWRLGGIEVLRLEPTSVKIDEKFLVLGGCPYECQADQFGFPCSVQVKLGNGALIAEPTDCGCTLPRTRPACQNAIFRECLDDISNACKVNCTYNVNPADPSTFSIGLVSQFTKLSVTESARVHGCGEEDCKPIIEDQCPCQHERDRLAIQQQSRRTPV